MMAPSNHIIWNCAPVKKILLLLLFLLPVFVLCILFPLGERREPEYNKEYTL